MKKIFYILFLYSTVLLAQGLPTRPIFPAGNGTNERFFRIGRHANYIAWNTTARSYFFVDSTVTPHDTVWFGANKWKDYTVYGKWTFKNLATFDSTVYLNDNVYADSGYAIGSPSFVSGWAGSGWKLDYGVTHAGRSTLELHDLWVRGNLNVYELLAHQIQGINGLFFISSSAKIDTVIGNNITFEDPTNSNLCPFAVNDLIMVQRFQPDQHTVVRTAQATVTVVSGKTVTVSVYSGTFHKGDYAVRLGNTTDATRQASIYLAADDSNAPFIDMINGVNSWAAWGAATKTKLRLGNLAGITDTDFGGALSGYGLYGQNVYLKGKLKIAGNSDIIGLSANVTITATTAPATRTDGTALVIGDLWIDSDGLNYRYRWNGSSWVDMNIPYVSTPTGSGLFIDGTHMGYYAASAWQTYIDNTGKFYFKGNATNYISWDGADFIVRGKITADDIYTGSLTALVERSSATMTYDRGIAGTEAGYWLGKYGLNDYRFFIGSSATKYFSYNNTDLTMVGGTITGGTIQTSTTINKIVLNGSTNSLDFYNGGTKTAYLHSYRIYNGNISDYDNYLEINSTYLSVGNTSVPYASVNPVPKGEFVVIGTNGTLISGIQMNTDGGGLSSLGAFSNNDSPAYQIRGFTFDPVNKNINIMGSMNLVVGSLFTLNSSGQITKVNNIAAAAKQVLIGDGSPTISFTPRLLAMSDLPALVANRVLLSDASGYIAASGVTNTTLGYLDATSSIQTQLNGKGGLAVTNTWTGLNTFSYGAVQLGNPTIAEGYILFYNPNNSFYTTLTGINTTISNKTITLPNSSGNIPLIETANTWTGENSFTKFKLGAEVSHSVTATGNYDCLDKNVVILTPTAAGYTATLTNLSPNRPILVLNGSTTYTVTVNAGASKLIPIYGCAWIMYNSTTGITYVL